MSRFHSEALGDHDRDGFISGHDRIDAYFQKIVSQDVKRRYAKCYVLVETTTGVLAGFYTLSATNILLADMPPELARRLPRYPLVPSVLIGWLGRHRAFERQGVGGMLLRDAILRIDQSRIGAFAVCADAIDAPAEAFYRNYQFAPLPGRDGAFFLPMQTALKARIEESGS